ncbi:hypothetical protein PPERSA_07683 [Pseudocohnilembus persalinus]|uniref:Uncharacterized protein n=1 Tax=Pseudocohnilembus persalinus TaxID=266149 RepID=A0A0V0QIQ8_PSEPJ|nr:hypothetical protein PPERSA_07683 [Pseudocohnilembus persalinus]|eukprot:KRX02038.1 hypothetical protein PPERSA_07683 [Pseudocohnilembus persalinus]
MQDGATLLTNSKSYKLKRYEHTNNFLSIKKEGEDKYDIECETTSMLHVEQMIPEKHLLYQYLYNNRLLNFQGSYQQINQWINITDLIFQFKISRQEILKDALQQTLDKFLEVNENRSYSITYYKFCSFIAQSLFHEKKSWFLSEYIESFNLYVEKYMPEQLFDSVSNNPEELQQIQDKFRSQASSKFSYIIDKNNYALPSEIDTDQITINFIDYFACNYNPKQRIKDFFSLKKKVFVYEIQQLMQLCNLTPKQYEDNLQKICRAYQEKVLAKHLDKFKFIYQMIEEKDIQEDKLNKNNIVVKVLTSKI